MWSNDERYFLVLIFMVFVIVVVQIVGCTAAATATVQLLLRSMRIVRMSHNLFNFFSSSFVYMYELAAASPALSLSLSCYPFLFSSNYIKMFYIHRLCRLLLLFLTVYIFSSKS